MTPSEPGNLVWKAATLAEVIAQWRAAEDRLICSTSQSLRWAETWQSKANPDCIAVTATMWGQLEFIVVLEVLNGTLPTARFCGGTHANGNFPATSKAFANLDHPGINEKIAEAIRHLRPEVGMVELSRLLENMDGVANPLLKNGGAKTDIILSLDITPGFEAVLAERSGSRKRKKIRQMANRMKERGGWTIRRPADASDIKSILARFFALKAKRLAESGVRDVFGDAGVRAFFEEAFCASAQSGDGIFELNVLEVDGVSVAITGSTIRNGELTVEFGGISDGDAALSPGDFLFFHMIEDACRRGLKTFSFGTGDEHYKRAWCDIETVQHDVFLPLNLRGRLRARAMTMRTAAKHFVKSNQTMNAAYRKIRKTITGGLKAGNSSQGN